jgi:type III pantothenate kinase
MDINLMTLNLGNSRLAIGVFAAGELRHVVRISHAEQASWPQAIATAWEYIRDQPRPAVAAAGVNPGLAPKLDQAVLDATGQRIQWVGKDLELPINVLTDPPDQTGVDRIVNIAAAYEQLGKACCVVDAGTAVTVDFCNDNGDFVGGAIAPGANLMLQSLHANTGQLPAVKLDQPTGFVGKSTAEAILQGVYHSIRGLVRETVEGYALEVGAWPEVIATGGDARLIFDGWEIIHAVSPDLTLYGIALAYTNHHIRHET